MNFNKIFDPNTKHYKILFGITCIVATVIAGFFISRAGSLNPTSAPGDTMVTLDDIYCKLTGCTPGTYGIDSPGSPAETMHTLQEIYDATPDFRNNPGDAMSGDCAGGVCVKAGKTFYTDSATKQTGIAQCVQASAPDSSKILTGYTICGVAGTFSPTALTWPTGISRHTVGDCTSAGGTVYDTGATGTICKFQAANCPTGWTLACDNSSPQKCWQTYDATSFGGDCCGRFLSTWAGSANVFSLNTSTIITTTSVIYTTDACSCVYCQYYTSLWHTPALQCYGTSTSYNNNNNGHRTEVGCY